MSYSFLSPNTNNCYTEAIGMQPHINHMLTDDVIDNNVMLLPQQFINPLTATAFRDRSKGGFKRLQPPPPHIHAYKILMYLPMPP